MGHSVGSAVSALAPPPAATATYTDIRGLQSMETDSPEALKKVAAQFESLFMDMWLKSMREAGAVFSEGNPFSSAAVKVHEEMLDHQYAVRLSEAGGIGIGDVLVAQLSKTASTEVPASDGLPGRTRFPDVPVNAAPAELTPLGSRHGMFSDAQQFVETLLPVVEKALEGTQLNPLGVLAQAALETGWGQNVIHDADGASSHNLFGIKANDWSGPSATIMTMEFEFDRMTPRQADFRSYENWGDSVSDYLDFLRSNDRYREVIEQGSDPEKFARQLQQSGYATDPDYADKLMGVVKRISTALMAL
jgi:flagellar protein FlgJ